MADEDEGKAETSDLSKKHHRKSEFSYSRPKYREARWERAVKVYTVNLESRYLLVQGVPTVGATKELLEMFALYGAIQEYQILKDYPKEEFTEVYWIKFQRINAARFAKRKTDNRSFFGGILHVSYAPEFESVDETRDKLQERRKIIARKIRELYGNQNLESVRETKDMVPTSQSTSKQDPKTTQVNRLHVTSTSTSATPVNASTTDTRHQPDSGYSSSYPQLPPPPLPLHPSQYPPPPSPWELPLVPSANATLPLHLQILYSPYLNPPPPPPPPPPDNPTPTTRHPKPAQIESHQYSSLPPLPNHAGSAFLGHPPGPPPGPPPGQPPLQSQALHVQANIDIHRKNRGTYLGHALEYQQAAEDSVDRTVMTIRNKLKQVGNSKDEEPTAKKQRKRI